jgi:hypothetical protein
MCEMSCEVTIQLLRRSFDNRTRCVMVVLVILFVFSLYCTVFHNVAPFSFNKQISNAELCIASVMLPVVTRSSCTFISC